MVNISVPEELLLAHTKIESIRVVFQLGVVKILLLLILLSALTGAWVCVCLRLHVMLSI